MKGYRTYASVIASTLVLAASVTTNFTILSPEVTGAVVTLLNALALYFRSQA